MQWSILTNENKWRLYEREHSRTGGTCYEVDLVTILQSQDREAFKYFYLFFRKDAFVPVRDDKSFVEIVYEESERYWNQVGDSLKEMDLLPVERPPYADYSMRCLQTEVNKHLRSGASYATGVCGLWHSLLDRFQLNDEGLSDNGQWTIPAYTVAFSPVSVIRRFPMRPSPIAHAGRLVAAIYWTVQRVQYMASKKVPITTGTLDQSATILCLISTI